MTKEALLQMINYLKALFQPNTKECDKEELFIVIAVCSIFLPFPCFLFVLFCVLIYLIQSKKIWSLIHTYPHSKYVFLALFINALTSIIFKNYMGLLCILGIFGIFLFILFYRSKIHLKLFHTLVNICCILSIFCFIYSILEYYRIIHSLNYSFFRFIVFDEPSYRVNATFFNANYYGTIIEFIILMCVYQLMIHNSWKHKAFYFFTIFCNFVALYFTGCRSAWLTFFVAIPIMLYINDKKKLSVILLAIEALIFIGICLFPTIFPRMESMGLYLDGRIDIWKVAIQGILRNPLLGYGPLAYYHIHAYWNGPFTQHAHSMYLDPILSFGIINTLLFCKYLGNNLVSIYALYKQKKNPALVSLIVGFIIAILVHGTMDYTIFWVQTAPIFFIVFSAFSIYESNIK